MKKGTVFCRKFADRCAGECRDSRVCRTWELAVGRNVKLLFIFRNKLETNNMELKLSFEEGVKTVDMPLAKLLVNDREAYFLVDTGANVCYIDETFAQEIGAEEIPPIIENAIQLSGNYDVSRAYNVAFTIDGMLITDVPCAATDTRGVCESIRESGMAMNGIIGMFLMRILHGSIDLDTLTITFRIPDRGPMQQE